MQNLVRGVFCNLPSNWGVGVADVVKALALVVDIATVWVRILAGASTKIDIGKAPCTEGAPMIQKQDVSGRPAHDS